MGGKRRGDHHGVDILARQEISVVGVGLRLGAGRGDALPQVRLIGVAYCRATAALQTGHVAQQVAALRASADHP